MRKIVVSNMLTVDGFVARANGELDWFMADEGFFEDTAPMFQRADTMLFGRLTYASMRDFWTSPDALTADPVTADWMNATPKLVLSRTLAQADWGKWDNARVLQGDLAATITQLKQQSGKDIVIYGSGSVVAQLTQLGLIDEYMLFINPVIIGSGKPEFANITRQVNLKLNDAKAYKNGLVRLIYTLA